MKKILSLFCAFALFGTVFSCSEKSVKGSNPKTVEAEQTALRAAGIEMAEDFGTILTLDRNDNGKILIFGQLKTGGYSGYFTDPSFSDHESFGFTPKDSEVVKSAAILKFGKTAVVTYLDGETYIYIYSSDGSIEKELNCGEVITDPEKYALIYQTENGYLLNLAHERLAVISDDGRYIGDINTGSMFICGVNSDSENSLICILGDTENMCIADINVDELSISKHDIFDAPASSAWVTCRGNENYRSLGVFDSGIYGIKEKGTNKLTDYAELPFLAHEINGIVMTDENEFAVSLYTAAGAKMYLLSERDISDLKSKKIVKAAFFGNGNGLSEVEQLIKYYNSENSDGEYRVELQSYGDFTGDDKGVEALKRDMISGNSPDIIPFNSYMPIRTFGAKESIFADMYTFIDSDPDFSREDFLPNVMEGLECNGKLLRITPAFSFSCLPAKSGYIGVKENWSVDDMLEAYENLPEGMDFFTDQEYNTREMYFEQLMKITFFVDYENAECSFDSPEFIKLMQFFDDNEIGLTWEEYDSLTGEIPQYDPTYDVRNGKTLISTDNSSFYNFGILHETVKGTFDDEITFVGFPYDGEKSGSFISAGQEYGIIANSPNIDGAWDFLRIFLSDYYYENVNHWGMSVLKDRFGEQCGKRTRDNTFYDSEKGEYVTEKWKFGSGVTGETEDIENFTQEECEYYKNMILNAQMAEWDNVILSIIRDEVNKFFAHEYSAEEAAAIIQNRVSIYLSEQYK